MPTNRKKKNSNRSGSITKRSDGRWQGRYSVPAKDGGSRYERKYIYGQTKEEVRRKLTEIQYEIDNSIYVSPTKTTIGSWLHTWLAEYVKHSVKALTYDAYLSICNNHIIPYLGDVALTSLTTDRIQKFYNFLIEEKKLSAKTVKNINGLLHKALDQAYIVGHIKSNPCNRTILPKVYKKTISPMSNDKIGEFLNKIKGHKLENLYFVTLFTGLRRGEILGLTWDCVDFERQSIMINKQLKKSSQFSGAKYVLAPTKNSECRKICLAPSVMEVLKKQKEIQDNMVREAGYAWNNNLNLVFTNELGSNLTQEFVYKNFKKIVKELGIPSTRFHDLRHTFATISLESGDDFKTLQGNLGHATASFTLDVYGHISDRMKYKSASNIQNYINTIN